MLYEKIRKNFPEVIVGLGSLTEYEAGSTSIKKLHILLEDWLGDDLMKCHPVYFVTENKKEMQYLTSIKDWSKYAFGNDKEYHTIIYDNESPIASVNNSFYDVTIDFIVKYDGKIIKHLTMVYDKYIADKLFKEDKYVKHLNETMFLSKIISYEMSDKMSKSSEILFKKNGNATIFITEIDKVTNKSVTSAQETKVNISHNLIRTPKFYNDFDYLLDYKNIVKSEYFNLHDNA